MWASLRLGKIVLAAVVVVVALGVVQLGAAKVDYLPEFMPPSVQVQTEALGLSAAEVEQLVTVPLEQDLLNGVPWLDHIHSRTEPGLSAIDIVFQNGTDPYAARQMVQERLTQAHALPNVGSPPVMMEPLASVSRVAMVGLTSESVSLIDMSVLARWKIRPKLMGIPGVANVAVYGMRDRQIQVQVDPRQLKDAGVNLTQVIETTGNALWVSPLTFVEASTPGTGGFIEGSNQRLAVQHVLPITTPETLAQVPIEGTATPKRLADVAQVVQDHQPLIGDAVSTSPTLFLVIQKFPDADTRAVTAAIEDAMASLQPGLGGITVDSSLYRPATFLESAAQTITWIGAVILLALLLATALLFWTWRAALVVTGAVLTTVVATLYLLYLRGTTLTSMTLVGILLATVLVISHSVSAVEAVMAVGRRDERPADSAEPDEHRLAVPDIRTVLVETLARTQRTAAVGALACALLIVPSLFLDQFTTSFTRAAATTFALALVVGLVVGLTLVPTLMALLTRRGYLTRRPRWAVLDRVASRASHQPRALRWVPAATALALVLVSLGAIPQLASASLIPSAQDRNLLVRLDTVEGTSLTEMSRVTGLVADQIRQVPGVASVGGHAGRAVGSDQLGNVNGSELWVTLSDSADYQASRAAMQSVLDRYAGVRSRLETYSADRVQTVAASTSDVIVRLFGQDLTALQQTATTVAKAMSGVDHLTDARVAVMPQQPTVQVEVDLAAAQQHNLRPGDVRREATTLASGLTVGNLYEQAQVFDVVVRGTNDVRSNLTSLRNLGIATPAGDTVRLGDVAKVTVTPQPAAIVHDQVMRSMDVTGRIAGGDPAAVVDSVRQAVASVPMPAEAHLQVLSPALDRRVDLVRTAGIAVAVVIAILLVLQAAMRSWRRAVALLVVCPLGAAGAVAVAPLVGGLGTVGPLLGGIAAVMLTLSWGLACFQSAPDTPGSSRHPGRVALVAAAVTAIAVLPATVVGERAGTELLRPFAVTLVGGLVSALVVVLVILPALAGRPKGAQA